MKQIFFSLKEVIFKAVKIFKPGVYIVGLLSFFSLLKIIDIFGFNSTKSIVSAIVLFSFLFLMLMFASIANSKDKKIHPLVTIMGIIIGFSIVLSLLLFLSCLYFDYPKNIRDLLVGINSDKENLTFDQNNELNELQPIEFSRLDYESCSYPIMFPDSFFKHEVKEDTFLLSLGSINDNYSFPKAPIYLTNFWGFKLPFTLQGNTENRVIITNRFKVKVYTSKMSPPHGNAERTCAGEGELYNSSNLILLKAGNDYYESYVSFPKADYYTLAKNEVIGFNVNLKIVDPGSYRIIIDVPYSVKGKKSVFPMDFQYFIAPRTFDLWEDTFVRIEPDIMKLEKSSSFIWDKSHYTNRINQL